MNCELESGLFIGRNWPHTIRYDSFVFHTGVAAVFLMTLFLTKTS